ncbi:type II toxin-antitoxin system RelE/ParE family toxin [Streptomyces filamentosus]|uniref:type II toxin-antitoxin system RelE/ParE family toxin n=1 Tax=Streptomyces filamentosus TaxID=67294 RepID=UPI003F4A9E4E
MPADSGPALGRPLVDRLQGCRIHNLKELRPASSGRSEVRILFVFDLGEHAYLRRRSAWRQDQGVHRVRGPDGRGGLSVRSVTS